MINFDNAATTGKKPESVIKAVNKALYHYSANPGRGGHKLSLRAGEAVYETREKISEFFGASGGENVIFTANCTAAINYVFKGFLKQGDHVIISDLEHNAVARPLEKTGVSKSVATVSLYNDGDTVKSFESHIKENTKMIFCTAGSNVCGKVLPIDKIGALCKKHGIAFGVDAAQMAGILPVNMEKCGIDFLCIAPHKGLYAPMGIGILIAVRDIGDTLIEGGTGTNSMSFYQPENMPERYESGTLNVPAIMGVNAGIDFVKSHGKAAYLKEMRIVRRIYDFAHTAQHIDLYTPYMSDCSYLPVLSLNIRGVPSEITAEYLNRHSVAVRAGLHCAPMAHRKIGTADSGTVRIAPGAFTTDAEADYLIHLLNNYKYIKK